MPDFDRTASILSPAKLAQVKPVAAVSPAAWIDQPPAQAGRQQVQRLHDLQVELVARVASGDDRELAAALVELARSVAQVDLSLLRTRGWLARAIGRGQGAAAQFAGKIDQVAELAATLAQSLKARQATAQAETSAAERRLVELEVECVALDQTIAQGTAWIRDMRSRNQPHAAEDLARCDALAERLGLLAQVATGARHARAQGLALLERRATAVLSVHQALGGPVKAWRGRMAALANTVLDAPQSQPDLEAPAQAQREIEAVLHALAEGLGQLQQFEAALAASLAALSQQLGTAR